MKTSGSASVAADAPGHPVDFIARAKPLYTGAHDFDDASEIETQNGGQRMAGMGRRAGIDLGIQRIDATCVDTNQYLSSPRIRASDGTEANRLSRCLSYRRDHGDMIGMTISIESTAAYHLAFSASAASAISTATSSG